MTISWRLVVLSIIIASAVSLGAYGSYLKRSEPAATDSPQQHPLVDRSADADQSIQNGKSSSESDVVRRGSLPPIVEPFAALEETLLTSSDPVEGHPAIDATQGSEANIGYLLHQTFRRLRGGAHQDLLRFILDEEIQEAGLDIDASVSLEAAIVEVAVARGMPSDVKSGVSDIQCTASLCTLLADNGGTFNMIRHSPEWKALEEKGPVPGLRSLSVENLGPVHMATWVRFGVPHEGQTRFYMYRPGIERHRDLLEAVVAAP